MLDFLKSKMYFPTFKPNKWESNDGGDDGGNIVLIEKWVVIFCCLAFNYSVVLDFVFLFICFSFLLFTTSSLLLFCGAACYTWRINILIMVKVWNFLLLHVRGRRKNEIIKYLPTTQLVNWRSCLLELFSESVIILTFLSYFYQIHWEVGEYLSLCCSTPILTKIFAISRAYSWKEIGHWSALSIPNKHIHCIYTVPVALLYVSIMGCIHVKSSWAIYPLASTCRKFVVATTW